MFNKHTLAFLSLVFISNITTIQMASAADIFERPRVQGTRVSTCIKYDGCGKEASQKAANAFCIGNGYKSAVAYQRKKVRIIGRQSVMELAGWLRSLPERPSWERKSKERQWFTSITCQGTLDYEF